MVEVALAAASALGQEGLSAEVIDLRGLRPVDWATCQAFVNNTHRCLIVDEASRFGGPAAEITESLHERCFFSLEAPIMRAAALDLSIPFNGKLEDACIPSEHTVIDAVHGLMGRS